MIFTTLGNRIAIFSTLVLTLALAGCGGGDSDNSNVGADSMTKSEFKKILVDEMPSELCTFDSPFRTCFTVTQSECLTQMELTTDNCIDDIYDMLPNRITMQNVEFWSGEVGECVALDYINTFESEFISSCAF